MTLVKAEAPPAAAQPRQQVAGLVWSQRQHGPSPADTGECLDQEIAEQPAPVPGVVTVKTSEAAREIIEIEVFTSKRP